MSDPASVIRPAEARDAAAVRACIRAAYAVYEPRLDRPPAPVNADIEAEIGRGVVWVLEERGETLGVIVLLEDDEGLLVENVAVAPGHQRKGLGRRLLAFADEEARRRGRHTVHLYTNEVMTENIELYGRLGFEETGRRREDGNNRVFMRKVVAPKDAPS